MALITLAITAGLMTRPEEGSAQEMVAPVSSMPMGEFASQRREFREQAHRLMVNKCRPHFYMHFRQKAWEVEPSRRTANLAYWSQRKSGKKFDWQSMLSRCSSTPVQ